MPSIDILPSEGGQLSVKTSSGDTITLLISPYSVAKKETFALDLLQNPPNNPLTSLAVPGITVGSSGLRLRSPATLKIELSSSIQKWDELMVFKSLPNTEIKPVSTTCQMDNGKITIVARTMTFSTFLVGFLALQKVEQLIKKIEKHFPPAPYDAYDFVELSEDLLILADMAELLGNSKDAGSYRKTVYKDCTEKLRDFLDLALPSDPCGYYFKTLDGFKKIYDRWQRAFLEALEEAENKLAGSPDGEIESVLEPELAAILKFPEAYNVIMDSPNWGDLFARIDLVADQCPIQKFSVKLTAREKGAACHLVGSCFDPELELNFDLSGEFTLRVNKTIKGKVNGTYSVKQGIFPNDKDNWCDGHNSGSVSCLYDILGSIWDVELAGNSEDIMNVVFNGPLDTQSKQLRYDYSVTCYIRNPPKTYVEARVLFLAAPFFSCYNWMLTFPLKNKNEKKDKRIDAKLQIAEK